MQLPHPDLLTLGFAVGCLTTLAAWRLRGRRPTIDLAGCGAVALALGWVGDRIAAPPWWAGAGALTAAAGAVGVAILVRRPAAASRPDSGLGAVLRRSVSAAVGAAAAAAVLMAVPDTEAAALVVGAVAPPVVVRALGGRDVHPADAAAIGGVATAAALLGGWPRPTSLIVLAPLVAACAVTLGRAPRWMMAAAAGWALVVSRMVAVAAAPPAWTLLVVAVVSAVMTAVSVSGRGPGRGSGSASTD